MSILRTSRQVDWASNDYVNLTAGAAVYSTAVNITVGAFVGSVSIRVDNQGTPGTNDIVTVKVLYSNGDIVGNPDASSSYETPKHANTVAVLNTHTEDPAERNIPISVGHEAFKIYVEANASATNTLRVYAQYTEQISS